MSDPQLASPTFAQRNASSRRKRPTTAAPRPLHGADPQLGVRYCELVYRLRLIVADALSLINRTLWLAPRTTMWITPEIEYSLL